MAYRRGLVMLALLVLAALPVTAQEDESTLREFIERYLSTPEDAERQEVLEWLSHSRFGYDAVRKALHDRRPTQDWKPGVHEVDMAGSKLTKVFVPKDYRADRRWPLLILLHGSGGDAKQLFNPMLEALEQETFLAIAPTSRGFGWLSSESSLTLASLEWMKAHFNVDTNKVYLFGASMGGFGTWNNGLRSPDRFAALFPYAGGLQWMTAQLGGLDRKGRMLVGNAANLGVYVLHGSKDVVVRTDASRTIVKQLEAYGFDHKYVEMPEWEHIPPEDEVRKLVLQDAWPWMKQRLRNPFPEWVRFVTFNRYQDRAYWVEIPGGGSSEGVVVSAKNLGQNAFEVNFMGASEIHLLLSQRQVDFNKPITVTSEGKTLFTGKVERSLGTLLESYRTRRDREMLADARLVIRKAAQTPPSDARGQ